MANRKDRSIALPDFGKLTTKISSERVSKRVKSLSISLSMLGALIVNRTP